MEDSVYVINVKNNRMDTIWKGPSQGKLTLALTLINLLIYNIIKDNPHRI